MDAETERRLLQAAIAAFCLVPLTMGAVSIWEGPAVLRGIGAGGPVDLDSHFRYLSGLLFALGLGFASCVPGIERKGARFRLLGSIVLAGGLARLVSLIAVGVPSKGHWFGFAMELGVVPLLMLWQRRVERTAEGPPDDARRPS